MGERAVWPSVSGVVVTVGPCSQGGLCCHFLKAGLGARCQVPLLDTGGLLVLVGVTGLAQVAPGPSRPTVDVTEGCVLAVLCHSWHWEHPGFSSVGWSPFRAVPCEGQDAESLVLGISF